MARWERWERLDEIAHFLYCPTMLGRHVAVARWHHRIHLIPGWLLDRLCDRLDEAYGLYDDEPVEKVIAAFENGIKGVTAPPVVRRTPPESWREDWDSPEDSVYDKDSWRIDG